MAKMICVSFLNISGLYCLINLKVQKVSSSQGIAHMHPVRLTMSITVQLLTKKRKVRLYMLCQNIFHFSVQISASTNIL